VATSAHPCTCRTAASVDALPVPCPIQAVWLRTSGSFGPSGQDLGDAARERSFNQGWIDLLAADRVVLSERGLACEVTCGTKVMTKYASGPDRSHRNDPSPSGVAQRRRDRIKHLHRMTREQQMALVEEARAARLAAHPVQDR
jgi:hypothetical protein